MFNENLNSDTNENNFQNQKYIDKQKQALAYSYETLGNLLSSAENFAGFQNEQYERYNISSATNHDELKSEFAWELNCFQMSLIKYKKIYGEYIFPEKYSKEKILNDIKRYIKNIHDEKDKILFFAMINILNGEKIDINFTELFEELENNSNSKFDPNKLANLIGPINYILEDIEKKAEEGIIDFNEKSNSKIKEKLVNIEKKSDIIMGITGKKGTLFITDESSNEYKFVSQNGKKEKKITLEEKIDLKNKKLYLGKYRDKSISIYISDKNNGFYYCCLFTKKIKEYEKSDIIICDNRFGYLKIPILLSEDLK